jgi:inner membrane protein
MGLAAALVYISLGRRRIDYRFVLLGAVLPDVIDGILGLFFFEGPSGRWIAHTLMAVVAVAVAVMVLFRGEGRFGPFGIVVGWFLHLVGDGMWNAPETFLWPAFGTAFSTAPREPYSWDLFAHPLEHGWTWAGEIVGAMILVWFWIAFRLGHDGRAAQFGGDGYLRP